MLPRAASAPVQGKHALRKRLRCVLGGDTQSSVLRYCVVDQHSPELQVFNVLARSLLRKNGARNHLGNCLWTLSDTTIGELNISLFDERRPLIYSRRVGVLIRLT